MPSASATTPPPGQDVRSHERVANDGPWDLVSSLLAPFSFSFSYTGEELIQKAAQVAERASTETAQMLR